MPRQGSQSGCSILRSIRTASVLLVTSDGSTVVLPIGGVAKTSGRALRPGKMARGRKAGRRCADEELGCVYLPVSTPTNDYHGGHRPGDGLYGNSLVCIEAATGRKAWHDQLIRHGPRLRTSVDAAGM